MCVRTHGQTRVLAASEVPATLRDAVAAGGCTQLSACDRRSGLQASVPPGHPFRRHLGGTGPTEASPLFPRPGPGPRFPPQAGAKVCLGRGKHGAPRQSRGCAGKPTPSTAPKAGAALPAGVGMPFPFLFKYRSRLGAEACQGWASAFSSGP